MSDEIERLRSATERFQAIAAELGDPAVADERAVELAREAAELAAEAGAAAADAAREAAERGGEGG